VGASNVGAPAPNDRNRRKLRMIVQKQREEKKEKRTRTRLISDIHVTVLKVLIDMIVFEVPKEEALLVLMSLPL
jgi:hypothetical protein